MIRMEIACFFVIMIMSIIYFSAKRKSTKIHTTFSLIMILSMVHLIFDAATVYTVNHMEVVPEWVNEGLHRLFIGTMVILFYLFYRYIVLMIEEETEKKQKFSWLFSSILIMAIIGTVVLPIYYMETDRGNYSYGPAAYMSYFSVGVHLVGVVILLLINWKKIHPKKKIGISAALILEIILAFYQVIHPLALMSGMGIMLINLAFYLTIQNPDIELVAQVQEEKKKAEEANKAKSVFLSQMSHEIRTPMNVVVGMTELMLRTDLTEEQREYLNNIKNSGNSLVSIINDILDISKIESGKMELSEEEYEVLPLLNDIRLMIENCIGDKEIILLYELDKDIPKWLYGDSLRIRQVIINLLNNAVKFTNEGQITLKVDVVSADTEEVSLRVSVTDTGQGIREEDLERLFQAFEQVDSEKNRGKEGTGLGLAISSNLIRMMGGELQVESIYGEGSEFYFTIKQKLAEAPVQETDSEAAYKEFTAPEAKILIVDDSKINLKIAVGLMKPLGMETDTARSGYQALNMVQKKKYDMIFMDHMMPGMDGVETTKRLRQLPESYLETVPVIAFTANAMKEAERSFYAAGMNGFIPKPIDVEHLYKTVYKWLPKDRIVSKEEQVHSSSEPEKDENTSLSLEGIDVREGVKNAGSTEFYREILRDFYLLIDTKSLKIERCIEDNLIRDYTVEVHALKTNARIIGALELSKEFLHLEQLGKEGDMEAVRRETPQVLAHYRAFKEILRLFNTKPEKKREASLTEVKTYLQGIREAIDSFDLDKADAEMKKLEECSLPEIVQEKMEELRVFVADVAMEDIMRLTKEMEDMIESC